MPHAAASTLCADASGAFGFVACREHAAHAEAHHRERHARQRLKSKLSHSRLGHGLKRLKKKKKVAGESADVVFSLLAIVAYLLLGVLYYHLKLDWTVIECMYFSFATVTTVGYGDFNGSESSSTMLFTAFFAFLGVGMIGLAIGELMEAIEQAKEAKKKKMIDQMSHDLAAGITDVRDIGKSFFTQYKAWSISGFLPRMTRVFIPYTLIGMAGALILLSTEPAGSGIMTSDDPLITSFYVSIITALSIGYGDFSPTSDTGRAWFIMYIPVSVVLMLKSLDEVNAAIRAAGTTRKVETVDIKELLTMDESGDAQVDMLEYVMYMLKSTGQVDSAIISGLENQFKALDASGDGTLGMDDFPPGMGLKRTYSTYNGRTVTEIEVVKLDSDTVLSVPEVKPHEAVSYYNGQGGETHSITVTVPPDGQPGQTLDYIKAPNGHPMDVIIPDGAAPGSTFEVELTGEAMSAHGVHSKKHAITKPGEPGADDEDAAGRRSSNAEDTMGVDAILSQRAHAASWSGGRPMMAVLSVLAYMLLGVFYYHFKLGWTVTEVVYFSFATITTVGYGDFNGSNDPGTMLFTAFFAFIGVGLISLAVGELVVALDELRAQSQRLMIDKMSADIASGVLAAAAKQSGLQRFIEWSKSSTWTRLVRMGVPVMLIGISGGLILIWTEPEESGIMTTDDPFTTSFYVSVITALSVGYGDFSPTSDIGRGLFIAFIPFSVVFMFSALDELNATVRAMRTTVKVEVVDIKEILLMDESGDAQVDIMEYVMYMLKCTGQVDRGIVEGLENQFKALDASGDGTLGMEDFPPGVGLKRTHSTYNGHTITEIEVVHLDDETAAAVCVASPSSPSPVRSFMPNQAPGDAGYPPDPETPRTGAVDQLSNPRLESESYPTTLAGKLGGKLVV